MAQLLLYRSVALFLVVISWAATHVLQGIPGARAAETQTKTTSPFSSSFSSEPPIPNTIEGSAASSSSQQCRNIHAPNNNLLHHRHPAVTGPLCRPPVDNGTKIPRTWAPWTHRPVCLLNKSKGNGAHSSSSYCLFTHAVLGDGGGVSVVATPEAAADLAAMVAALAMDNPTTLAYEGDHGRGPTHDDDGLNYGHHHHHHHGLNRGHSATAVRVVPGKGLGVLATQPIPRGTVLLSDRVRLLVDVEFPARVRRVHGQQLLHQAAGQLAAKEDVRRLARNHRPTQQDHEQPAVGEAEEAILRTNSFAVTVHGVSYMALLAKISRINHACNPTAVTRFHAHNLSMDVLAFRDIQPGEEITISYTDFGLTYRERQARLQTRWGFTCTCGLCRGGPDADTVAASDRRRRRVATIRGEVVALLQQGRVHAAVHTYEDELLGLVRAEHLAEHMGEHYGVLARLHRAAGNRTGAAHYAQWAIDEMEVFGGRDVFASVAELEGILQKWREEEWTKGAGVE